MKWLRSIAQSQQFGLLVVTLALGLVLSLFSGSHEVAGRTVNNFLNANTIVQVLTDTSVFAIMAVGMTVVIISAGIDLSVGAIYALAGVGMSLVVRAMPSLGIFGGLLLCLAIGLLAGIVNGGLIVGLNVHPFIITLGTMLIFRGIAFVATRAQSIPVPHSFTEVAKATLGLGDGLYPVPALLMIGTAVIGAVYLQRTVMGRRVFAVGGNITAARFSGLPVNRVLVGVYAVSGLTAGLAAWLGASYYGSAASGDGSTYELYVIASAVVGGASLTGGRGNAMSAMLGALLIALMRQSVRSLHFDQNYESIIIGTAIIAAVVFDRFAARSGASGSRQGS